MPRCRYGNTRTHVICACLLSGARVDFLGFLSRNSYLDGLCANRSNWGHCHQDDATIYHVISGILRLHVEEDCVVEASWRFKAVPPVCFCHVGPTVELTRNSPQTCNSGGDCFRGDLSQDKNDRQTGLRYGCITVLLTFDRSSNIHLPRLCHLSVL